ADDDVGDAEIQVALDGVQVADAAADLDRDVVADFLDDGLDDGLVARLACDSAVQVDQMQASRALLQPVGCHGDGVFRKHRRVVQVALAQAYAAPVFEVYGGNQQHGGGKIWD